MKFLKISSMTYSREAVVCFVRNNEFGAENEPDWFSDKERSYIASLRYAKRRQEYRASRISAKGAAKAFCGSDSVIDISVGSGVLWNPYITVSGHPNLGVSICHTADFSCAAVFDEAYICGIDAEQVNERHFRTLSECATEREKALLLSIDSDEMMKLTLLWTIHEALSKALRTGLSLGMDYYEISEIAPCGSCGCLAGKFALFTQFEFYSFISQKDRTAFSVAVPKNSSCRFENADAYFYERIDKISLKL